MGEIDMLLWGPGLEAELEFRRERMRSMWGRPPWVDRLVERRADHRRERAVATAAARGWPLPGSGAWPAR